jgi:2-methylcitrate dehydratase PrpD
LDVDKTVNAIGIAGTQAAGLRQVFGTMCKPLHAGKASMDGLFAAQLAARGFDCSKEIVEGKEGFTHTFTPDANLACASEELGKRYEILNVMFKRYASCFGTHPTIDAALDLRKEGLRPEDIVSVKVTPFYGLHDAISIMKPENNLEAKFSVPYTFAVAFIEGKAGEDEFNENGIRNPEIVKIRDKVTMEKNENMPQNCTLVVVQTRSGRILEKYIDINEVFKDSKKKEESLRNKFFSCATKVLPEDRSQNLYVKIMGLERIENISDVIALSRK